MFKKRQPPHWWKKLVELGNATPRHSDTNKRSYRTSSQRFFWGLAGLFTYFLLGAYVLGGDGSGSSDNVGIYKLLIGALIVGGLAAFLAPRLNEGLERMLPSGRRKQEELKKKQTRSSRSSQRSSSSSRSGNHDSSRGSRPQSIQAGRSDQPDRPADKTDK